ncbi:uncharacterized protein LOC110044249 [Orbicella faveolata]|uniref:uncharacterized protein LOC110044249 n=1 Tax=Orbicella faveolata TaxID=48498 RepID=UPI0009E40B7B|nr:uncharacterized protein LOC110044249 [Orbicella faveolata]
MANQLSQRVGLFNCDGTYKLDAVERFLIGVQEKHGFAFSTDKRYFGVNEMPKFCETILPQVGMDFAIFVVHAEESRLSINEDNAGIGYTKIYRALLQATDGRVLIVIGGDDHYRDKEEEERTVISRWARRKVASQFNEEYLDGRKSFIFSWNKQHREIHEEALLHYFDPSKKGQKFEYQPKLKPVPLQAKTEEPIITSRETVKNVDATGNSRPKYDSDSRSRSVREQPKEGHTNPSYGATNPVADYQANTMSKSYNYDGAVPHQVAFSDGTPCWRRNWLPIFVAVVVVVVVIVLIVAFHA